MRKLALAITLGVGALMTGGTGTAFADYVPLTGAVSVAGSPCPNAPTTITAQGFAPGTSVHIEVVGVSGQDVTANASGAVTASVTSPSPGVYDISATGTVAPPAEGTRVATGSVAVQDCAVVQGERAGVGTAPVDAALAHTGAGSTMTIGLAGGAIAIFGALLLALPALRRRRHSA